MHDTAIMVVGLTYGDESKGATVDKLTRCLPVDTIVRFNGGSQCAHNVVTPEGVHHTFSQFGSGMLASTTVRTHLSQHVLVDPISMMNEGTALATKTPNVWERVTVAEDAVIITPWHKLLNRARELRRGADDKHGSCGMGVGAARELSLAYPEEVLRAKDLKGKTSVVIDKLMWTVNALSRELVDLRVLDVSPTIGDVLDRYMEWPAQVVYCVDKCGVIIFEGAQGILLDETHGVAPYNTWTDTTFNNAEAMLNVSGFRGRRVRLGCVRSYLTRHGAGPLEGEDGVLSDCELHNFTNEFQGPFRTAPLDVELVRKAIEIAGGIDGLSVSHLDCSTSDVEKLEEELAPVIMYANGPTANDRWFTRRDI